MRITPEEKPQEQQQDRQSLHDRQNRGLGPVIIHLPFPVALRQFAENGDALSFGHIPSADDHRLRCFVIIPANIALQRFTAVAACVNLDRIRINRLWQVYSDICALDCSLPVGRQYIQVHKVLCRILVIDDTHAITEGKGLLPGHRPVRIANLKDLATVLRIGLIRPILDPFPIDVRGSLPFHPVKRDITVDAMLRFVIIHLDGFRKQITVVCPDFHIDCVCSRRIAECRLRAQKHQQQCRQ